MSAITRAMILEAIAKSLRTFGYPDCTADNVLTIYLFSQFAKSQLEDLLRDLPREVHLIQPMLDEIAELEAAQ